MTAFLISTDTSFKQLPHCNGDLGAMQKAVRGNLELVPLMEEGPFDIYVNDEGALTPVGMNDLGAFIIDACYGRVGDFIGGVRGPVLITAREDEKRHNRSLSREQLRALTDLCKA
jgi:hypothetical protein